MVLQSRVAPRPQALQRIETLRSEIEVQRSHAHPSDELLYFLVDREEYQLKTRLLSLMRRNPGGPLALHLTLTLYDKDSSLAETAELWKLQLNRKSLPAPTPAEALRELLHLLKEAADHLASPYNFSELARNREATRRYVIDFKVDLLSGPDAAKGKSLEKGFRLRHCRARLSEDYELSLDCYSRQNLTLPPAASPPSSAVKPRKASEETRADSCSAGSLKELLARRYSIDEQQQQAFEFYDSELDVTILSSDSDSPSQSRRAIPEEECEGEGEGEFELLIEESTDEDEMFVLENEAAFENWQKYLQLNFH